MFAFLGPLYLVAVAWPLAKTDLREHRLPNRLVLPAISVAMVGQCLEAAITGEWARLGQAVGVAAFAFLLTASISFAGALGMGDAKLIAAISLSLGWFSPMAAALAVGVAMTAALVPALRLVKSETRLKSKLPLGPYLLVGFAVAFALQFY